MLTYRRDTADDSDRSSATEWARALLQRDPNTWVILDTETTGLGRLDEICQIAIIDGVGNVLLNKLVKPTIDIPEQARSIHGISNEIVQSAESFEQLIPEIQAILQDRLLVIYNASFDIRMLNQSASAWNCALLLNLGDLNCAMKKYAQWYGDWNERRGDYRWQSLPGGDHSAVGDCLAVLKLINKMGAQ